MKSLFLSVVAVGIAVGVTTATHNLMPPEHKPADFIPRASAVQPEVSIAIRRVLPAAQSKGASPLAQPTLTNAESRAQPFARKRRNSRKTERSAKPPAARQELPPAVTYTPTSIGENGSDATSADNS